MHRGAIEPVQKTFVSELSPMEHRASLLGAFQMTVGLCALPASLIAGLLWDTFGKHAPFYFSLGLTSVAVVLMLFLTPINRQKKIIDKWRCMLNNKADNVIEVLYTEHCPFWREVAKTIDEVLGESEIKALVKRVKVSSEGEAKRLGFPGSPTVRINGVDIDPLVKETTGAIGCRIYMYQGKMYDFPPRDMIEKAVKRLIKN